MELIVFENSTNLEFNDDVHFIDCMEISPCLGCAGCWTKTPGTCVIEDKAQHFAKKIQNYDTITLVSKLCFGGVSYLIKRIIDRCVGYLDTFMVEEDNDIRHGKRYEHSFNLNVVFYGNGTDEEKEEANQLIKSICQNYYIKSYNVEFVSSFETAYYLLGGKKVDNLPIGDDNIVIPMHKETEKPKNSIAVINTSARGKKSASEFYANKFIEVCNSITSEEIQIDKYHWSPSKPISSDEIMKFTQYDSIVLCVGIYVDTLPSHVIENLQRIDEYLFQYLKNHTYGPLADNIKNTRVYLISNNGLIHGNQSTHALNCVKYFAYKNKFKWVQGLGIGGGPLYANPKIDIMGTPEGKYTYDKFKEFCSSVINFDEEKIYNNLYTNCYMELDKYKKLLNDIWSKALHKNNVLIK